MFPDGLIELCKNKQTNKNKKFNTVYECCRIRFPLTKYHRNISALRVSMQMEESMCVVMSKILGFVDLLLSSDCVLC